MLISEQLFFLALKDDSGQLYSATHGYLEYGLGFAILFDLYFRGKIRFEGEKVFPVELSLTQDSLLDYLLPELQNMKNGHRIADWLVIFDTNYHKLKNIVYSRLQTQGIIKKEEIRKLKLFVKVRYPIIQPEHKKQIREQLDLMLLDKSVVNEMLYALFHMIKVSRLLNVLYTKETVQLMQKKMEIIENNSQINKSLLSIMHEIEKCFSSMMLTAPQ